MALTIMNSARVDLATPGQSAIIGSMETGQSAIIGGMEPLPIHVCGTADQATGPDQNHYQWHLRTKTGLCDKARKANAWAHAQWRIGQPIVNFEWKPRKTKGWGSHNRNGYECGPASAATGPSLKHYSWHRNHRTDPCERSREEAAWYKAEQKLGSPIPDFIRRQTHTEPEGGWVCGPAEEAAVASKAHSAWHERNGTEPCLLARKESAWWLAEFRTGMTIDDYDQYQEQKREQQTSLYRRQFEDGKRYWGISAQVAHRWKEEQAEPTLLGKKLRGGEPPVDQVIAVCPDYATAERLEKAIIKADDSDLLLNERHNNGASEPCQPLVQVLLDAPMEGHNVVSVTDQPEGFWKVWAEEPPVAGVR